MTQKIILSVCILLLLAPSVLAGYAENQEIARAVASEMGDSWGFESQYTGRSYDYSPNPLDSTEVWGYEIWKRRGSHSTSLRIVFRPDRDFNLSRLITANTYLDGKEGTILREGKELKYPGLKAGQTVLITKSSYSGDYSIYVAYGVYCDADNLFVFVPQTDSMKSKPSADPYLKDAKDIMDQVMGKLRKRGVCISSGGGEDEEEEDTPSFVECLIYEAIGIESKACDEMMSTPTVEENQTQGVSDEEMWQNISERCNGDIHPTLSEEEFLLYIRKLESRNPNMQWSQMVSGLHGNTHPHDVGASLPSPFSSVPLFQNGSQTDGWQDVNLLCVSVPRFVIDNDGTRIDISHSYAGLRAGLNRDRGAGRWLMQRLNTRWGDYWQLIFEGPGLAPPDQLIGDDVGIWLADYYDRPENKNKPLSEAYNDYFNPPPQESVFDRLPDLLAL